MVSVGRRLQCKLLAAQCKRLGEIATRCILSGNQSNHGAREALCQVTHEVFVGHPWRAAPVP